jgi:hypothetical protein
LQLLILKKIFFTFRVSKTNFFSPKTCFMISRLTLRLSSLILIISLLSASLVAQIPSPREFFGFTPGDDRMMFNYDPLMEYMQLLASNSPMVHVEQYGRTEMGKPMYIVFISSAANISNLDRLKEINRMLALDEIPGDQYREALIREGKVFFLSTLSMHATEVGPVQALPLVAYELVTGKDPRRDMILENSVAMFIPHNPDGMDMIVDHYNKHKGTTLETSNMPGVYHKYVGHNINRDFVTLTQSENQMVADVYSTQWFPQAMVERHQMGSGGPRFFVSPPSDPVAENVDFGIWNWMRVFGSRAITEMTDAGLASVSVNYLFDDYWPGATTTSIWKGVIGMLSEAASANIATPIYVEPNELRPGGKGLSEYEISINLPKPWEGGWWKLSDILRYEFENTLSYLYTSAIHKDEILLFRNQLSRREIARGKQEAPFYYILPLGQHDQSEMVEMVNLLHRHGIKSYQLKEPTTIQNRTYGKGDVVIPLAQPYRAFIKEILENQRFPARHYTPGGEMIRPYDITSWSLPLHRGVEAAEINTNPGDLSGLLSPIEMPFVLKTERARASWALFSAGNNESYKAMFVANSLGLKVERTLNEFSHEGVVFPVGSFLIPVNNRFAEIEKDLMVSPQYLAEKPNVELKPVKVPRVAIVETWAHDMDGGWLRFIFDSYKISYSLLRPADLQTARLQRDYDMLFFTDRGKSVYMTGKFESDGKTVPSRYPAEFAKGMDKKGFENLIQFINSGGKVMAWGPTTELFMGTISTGEEALREVFALPVRDIGKELTAKGLYVPGSLLKVRLRQDHPLTLGMPGELGVFHRGTPVFRTSIPYFDMDRRVIATFDDEKVLLSGFAQKEELLRKEAALVWLAKGKGQVILSSFNPQFRASTRVTYKLIFNAMLME